MSEDEGSFFQDKTVRQMRYKIRISVNPTSELQQVI